MVPFTAQNYHIRPGSAAGRLPFFSGVLRRGGPLSCDLPRRAYLIVWQDGKIGLRPEGLLRGESPELEMKIKIAKNESFRISFPAALIDDAPAEWIFWPSGNCEPATVSYQGRDGKWTANYSALTARSETVSYVAK